MRSREQKFLSVSRQDMDERGWDFCDFIFISGDAYVDHPSFATAIISRVLEADGFRVGIIPQPNWQNPEAFLTLGIPRLAFLVGSGNMDSLVAHYTAAKRKRSDDAYTPGGKAGARPDRAILKYVEGLRSAVKKVPVIIGGIEASLRRFAHYDYWSDTVRRSILLDSKADILVYGMGEAPIREIARRLAAGEDVRDIRNVRGTCVYSHGEPPLSGRSSIRLPDYPAVRGDDPESLRAYAEHFMLQKKYSDPLSGAVLLEKTDERWVLRNPPAFPADTAELDRIYELPYTRHAHPRYEDPSGIPALKEVSFSLVSTRGCYGSCSFCAIAFHQGRVVRGRSKESLIRETKGLIQDPSFKGYIHDVGGPTANFFRPPCARQKKGGACPERECLYPSPCPSLQADHREYTEVLQALRSLSGIKKVFIRSGLRFDYLLLDKNRTFLHELCAHHVSGQLKVAPEHCSARVLDAMGKSGSSVYDTFRQLFYEENRTLGLKQHLIPYFISSHPGSTLEDAVELALYLKKTGFIPDQVQDFYPTPGTLSTTMYHTGLDPRNMKPIHVPKGERERRLQGALLRFDKEENYSLVQEALRATGREDLIGNRVDCLIPFKNRRRFIANGDLKKGRDWEEESNRSQSTKEVPRFHRSKKHRGL